MFADAASFAFTSSESGSQFQCSLDFGPWASCTSVTAYARIGEGDHVFVVRARDAAGNYSSSPAVRLWTRERQGGPDGERPSSEYSPNNSACTGGRKKEVDPIGVMFEGKHATFNNVRSQIAKHIPGWDHLGSGTDPVFGGGDQWVKVRTDSGTSCNIPDGDTATKGVSFPGGVADRYHVRLWPIPKSQGAGQNHKKVVGTPHYEVGRGGVGGIAENEHCIPVDGFNMGRHHLSRLFKDPISGNHHVDIRYWGNTDETSHCGKDRKSNGNVAIISVGHTAG